MSCLDAALQYHKLGLHPIPVEPRGKRPLVSWKDYQQTQPTPGQIVQWWTDNPDANVALVLGRGMFAVDIDGPEGEAALEAVGIELPFDAPKSSTGKGRHVFLKGDAPDRIGLLPKVDIRGVGYVVAPPSIHPNGSPYAWVIPMYGELEAAPEKLMALIGAPKALQAPANAAGWLIEALAGVEAGRRDDTCTRLAGYFWGKGMPAEAVYETLLGWATRCDPPFSDDEVRKCVESISKRDGGPSAPPADIGALMPVVLAGIQKPALARATELEGLDKQLDGGFEPGSYILLGARPGVGKTALALQLSRTAGRKGIGTLIVSREMAREAIIRRMLAQESLVRFQSIKNGELEDFEWKMLHAAAARLSEMPIWISNLISVDQLSETLAQFEPGEIGFVIVDYLQLMRAPGEYRGDKRGAVEYVSQELRQLAIQYRVPLLCLSSLARPPRDMPRWRPGMADLRESGELEHDADIILLMHRDPGAEECELNVAKNRDGRVGAVHLNFRGEYLTFEGMQG